MCLPSGFGNATDRHIVATKFFDAFFPTHVKPMLMSIIIAIITVTLIMAVLQSNLYLAQWISPVLVYSMLSSIRKRDTEMAQYHHPMHALVRWGQGLRLCNCHTPKMHSNVSMEPRSRSLAMYKTILKTASLSVPAISPLPDIFLPLTVVREPVNLCELVANLFYVQCAFLFVYSCS